MRLLTNVINTAIVALLLADIALADVVGKCITLASDSAIAATATGTIYDIPSSATAVTAVATASNTSGTTPTLDLKVQSCRTKTAATCADAFTFDQCTTGSCFGGDTIQYIDLNQASSNIFPYLRAVATLGGTSPVYDYSVMVCYK